MYDTIIIGGGPAGLNAALYALRGGMKTLLIEKLFCGGQAATTYEVENYIGFPEPISGPELVMNMEEHVKRFGAQIVDDEVISLELEGDIKTVVCSKEKYSAKTVILCTGATPRTLGLENEDSLRGNGVSYCATCDGAFYRQKIVAVVGGGDTALEDALFLANFTNQVYLIHRRDSFRGAKILADKVLSNEKIVPVYDSIIESINTDDGGVVKSLSLKNIKTDETTTINVNGLFVAIGTKAENGLFKDKIKCDESGYIITDETMKTSIDGVFAAGDIRKKPLRQIITAAADGAVAATSAIDYVLKHS
ncbi:MAG: thioredoxin-disulfide reductase [Ruminococcaceae bacterium]|nr:thioredoxin-disulfide reductase [Oscillospiraceae bacterium]